VDLKFTEEQGSLRDMARHLCRDHCGIDVVRRMENDPLGVPGPLWAQMRETGLLGVLLPEDYGGLGLGMIDCVIVYEELGRALAPGPYFDSAVMSLSAIARAGDAAQKSRYLAALGSGELIVVPAWLEPDRGFGPAGVQLRASRQADGYRLTGIKRHVFYARAAQQLLVLARTGGGERDIDLLLVDAQAPGVRLEQQRSMASDTQYEVTFTDARVPLANRVGAPGSGWETWQATMHDGLIPLAAWAVGGAQRALEITVQYAKTREQFGKPIGAFQALAHYMADASAAVDGAQTLVLEAAWAHSAGRDTQRLAPMAKLFACSTFRDVTAMAQQVHGGLGFTLDCDIQLFYRRAKQLQMNWWDSRYLEHLVAADILDRPGKRTIPDPFTV
jgi:alkylation response protein AidB-like acyl-CoA dehydrogenase